MKYLVYSVLLATGTALAPSSTIASEQAAIEFRESAMTIYKWYLGPMGKMVKGTIPFDKKQFQMHAKSLATISKIDITPGFPEGSDFDTEAKPEIWEEWDLFKQKFSDFQAQARKLGEISAAGSESEIKAQFGKTAKTCGGCHKKFREK